MLLRKATQKDSEWIYIVLEELRRPVNYPLDQFQIYFKDLLENNSTEILILSNHDQNIGMVTLNKFSMPRYLGYGFEMEEFVIHKDFRRKGYSYLLIEEVKKYIQKDTSIRKLIIKSNSADSKHLYAKALNETDLITFQQYLHKL